MIKNLGSFLEKKANLFFLGGFFENRLINNNFLTEVIKLESSDTIYQNLINLISQPQRNLHNIIQSPSNKVYHPIQELAKNTKDV